MKTGTEVVRAGLAAHAGLRLPQLGRLFLVANLTKPAHGAWLPLLIGLTAFTVMTTGQRGRRVVTAERERAEGSLRSFIESLRDRQHAPVRVPGTAVFLNRGKQTAPLALRANVEHNHVLHRQIVILSVETRTGSASTTWGTPVTASSTSV